MRGSLASTHYGRGRWVDVWKDASVEEVFAIPQSRIRELWDARTRVRDLAYRSNWSQPDLQNSDLILISCSKTFNMSTPNLFREPCNTGMSFFKKKTHIWQMLGTVRSKSSTKINTHRPTTWIYPVLSQRNQCWLVSTPLIAVYTMSLLAWKGLIVG